jgi:hypothetical protein
MNYNGKIAQLLRKPFNDMDAKMMPQMNKSKMGQKLLEHYPMESKVYVKDSGMALKQS